MPGFEGVLSGRILAGRYLVERLIGRGGMGAVHRAQDQRLGRPVAVKVIMAPGADAAQHERLRQRFLHEARAAARLRHPNVVTVHDYGTDDALGLDYLVMELLEGEDLARRTAQGGRLPAAAALGVVSQAARGLAAGHRTGMVHRDVKPGNLFLEVDEHGEVQVRVLDFGIAQVAFDEPAPGMGGRDPLSPTFAAPEQLSGSPRLTPAADVFSLAAVALYLLNGQRPFTGNAETQAAEAEAALARLTDVPEATRAVREVLRTALAMDPSRRWPDAIAFRRALEEAHGSGLDTLPASVIGIAPQPDAASASASDDVTLFAAPDHEHTLHAGTAPSSSRVAAPMSLPSVGAASRAGRRIGAPPPAPRSGAPLVVAGVLALAAAGGAMAYLRPWSPDKPAAPPVAVGPDSATLDSLARQEAADSLARLRRQQNLIDAALDSVRRVDSLAREQERLAQAPTMPVPDTGAVPPGPTVPLTPRDAYDLSEVERQPRLRNLNEIRRYLERNYPSGLRESRVNGSVQVSFVVDEDGRPEAETVRVQSTTHPAFESAAVRAAERMRFTPAELAGRRVRVRVTLPIQFQIAG